MLVENYLVLVKSSVYWPGVMKTAELLFRYDLVQVCWWGK